MAAKDYGTIVNGVCTGMIVLDPDLTDPTEFGHLIGALLIAREDHLGGRWSAGAMWDGTTITVPEAPAPTPAPTPDPGADPGDGGDPQPPAPSYVTREEFNDLLANFDWVINVLTTEGT